MSEYESFTMFAKFGEIFERTELDDKRLLATAIVDYAYFGIEDELPYHLELVMIAIREDIDNSREARNRGAKGGRPKAKAKEKRLQNGEEAEKPPFSKTENHHSEIEETPLSEIEKPPFSKTENHPSEKNESQYRPIQDRTDQTSTEQTKPKEREGEKRKRFSPPARDEAADYAKQIGLPPGEADRFLDHYAANGWRVGGKSPMRDWRASMRNWARNADRYGTASPGEREVGDEYASL